MPETAKSECEAIWEVKKVRRYEEFEGIDNNVECYNENEDCEDEIVESIQSKHQDEEWEGEESDEDDTSVLELMQEGSEGSPLSALDVCAEFVSEMWNVSLSFYIFLTIYMKLCIIGAAA